MAVSFLGGNQQLGSAVHGDRFLEDLLHGSGQPGLHAHLRQNAGHHRFLGAQMFLLLRQITQQQPHHDQVDREHEQTLRFESPHVDMKAAQEFPGQRSSRTQGHTQQEETLSPQQGDFGGSRTERLPQAPAIGSRRQHEEKEQKERSARSFGENRDQSRPYDIRGMHQQTKGGRRLLPPPQQHHDENAVGQIKNKQAVGRPGMTQQLGGIHANRQQGRARQEHARGRQPALDPAGFAGIGRNSQSP